MSKLEEKFIQVMEEKHPDLLAEFHAVFVPEGQFQGPDGPDKRLPYRVRELVAPGGQRRTQMP